MYVIACVFLRLERTEKASDVYPVLFQAGRKPAAEIRPFAIKLEGKS